MIVEIDQMTKVQLISKIQSYTNGYTYNSLWNKSKSQLQEILETLVYEKMCSNCPSAKKCHEQCDFCDDYYDELFEITEENL